MTETSPFPSLRSSLLTSAGLSALVFEILLFGFETIPGKEIKDYIVEGKQKT